MYSFYKREAAPKSVRAYLNELTEKLKATLSDQGIEFSDKTSFGDLYQEAHPKDDSKERDPSELAAARKASEDKAEAVRSLLDAEQWGYLYDLNDATNRAVHRGCLVDPASGIRTMLCPAGLFRERILQQVAANYKMVDDPSKLVVKPDDRISPPMGPGSRG